MNNYIEESLTKNEKIVKRVQLCKWAILPNVLFMIFMFILILAPVIVSVIVVKNSGVDEIVEVEMDEVIGAIGAIVEEDPQFLFVPLIELIVAFIPTIITIIRLSTNVFCVTDRRILGKTGVFSLQMIDIPIGKIDAISVKTPFLGRIFNYSTIEVESGQSTIDYKLAKDAQKVKNIISQAIEENKENLRMQQAADIANAFNSKNINGGEEQ